MRNEWHGNPPDFLRFLSSFCWLNSLRSFIVIAISFASFLFSAYGRDRRKGISRPFFKSLGAKTPVARNERFRKSGLIQYFAMLTCRRPCKSSTKTTMGDGGTSDIYFWEKRTRARENIGQRRRRNTHVQNWILGQYCCRSIANCGETPKIKKVQDIKE